MAYTVASMGFTASFEFWRPAGHGPDPTNMHEMANFGTGIMNHGTRTTSPIFLHMQE